MKIGRLLAAVAAPFILMIAAFGAFSAYRLLTPAENPLSQPSEPTDWMPQTAKKIVLYETYFFIAAEFDCEEDAYRDWATQRGIQLAEIGDSGAMIPRYLFHVIDRKGWRDEDRWESSKLVKPAFYDGIFGYNEESGTTYLYDREGGRGYYHYSHN